MTNYVNPTASTDELILALLGAQPDPSSDRQGLRTAELCRALGWSDKKTRRVLARLVEDGLVYPRPITILALNGQGAASWEYVLRQTENGDNA